jgi:enoyl-CoA hydratase/carnithine racemase
VTLTEPITVQRDGHVLLIGINRPAKRNAVNLAAMDALCGAYEILGTDEQLRAGCYSDMVITSLRAWTWPRSARL